MKKLLEPHMLLVTCCLEQARADILTSVIDNILEEEARTNLALTDSIVVFDNASTVPGVVDRLRTVFKNVYQSNQNVGYWSAIDWFLTHIPTNAKYTYMIESDMLHYAFDKIENVVTFLDNNLDVGSCRLHEYSVAEKHLWDKDNPVAGSKVNSLWQSHTNKVTNKKITLTQSAPGSDIYVTNFLTQMPAVNRASTLKSVIESFYNSHGFTERDIQAAYHQFFQKTAILDGGIFKCDERCHGLTSKSPSGSWTPTSVLDKIGYKTTRVGNIVPQQEYYVTKLT